MRGADGAHAACFRALVAAAAVSAFAGCYTTPIRRPAAHIEAEESYCHDMQGRAESIATEWIIGSSPMAPYYRYARFGYLTEGVFRDEYDENLATCELIAHVDWTDDTMSIYRFVFLDGELLDVVDVTPPPPLQERLFEFDTGGAIPERSGA